MPSPRKKIFSYSIASAVDKEWLTNEGSVLIEAISTDDTWNLLRLKPADLMGTGIATQEVQPVPSWGGFNSILYPDLVSRSCNPTARLDTVP